MRDLANSDFVLIINDQEADVRSLMCHFQQEPYPGGLIYRLAIRNKEVISAARKEFGLGTHYHPDQSKQLSFLSYLFPMIAKKCGRIEFRFWANTIDDLELSKDVLVLKGVCSPHVGRRIESSSPTV